MKVGDDDEEDRFQGWQLKHPLGCRCCKRKWTASQVWSHRLRIAIESLFVKDSNASQDDIPYEDPTSGLWMRTCRGHSTSTWRSGNKTKHNKLLT
ncbi:hypothetical protein Scep_020165 [Stephania cephalantha]|uniref:Uncharacterized protein n=1 Tax=Stephania cephalantha TaxID=152367 RepID=A0AAP0NQJ8_9MAGN